MHFLGPKFSSLTRLLAVIAFVTTVWNGSALGQTIQQVDSAVKAHTAAAMPKAAETSGEANLVLPDLSSVSFMGMNGHNLLMLGLVFCALGLIFGLSIMNKLKNMPVHRSMREISELIYE